MAILEYINQYALKYSHSMLLLHSKELKTLFCIPSSNTFVFFKHFINNLISNLSQHYPFQQKLKDVYMSEMFPMKYLIDQLSDGI